MPFDGLFLQQVCQELNQKLQGGRIDKIYQPEKELIVLHISQPGTRYRLLLCANAENNRSHLTEATWVNPTMPPVFCMVLRKHLEGARITEFQQPGLDRVLEMRVKARDELGQPVVKSLLCEIMGRHSNIILVNRADNTILDGIRRYSHAVSRHREVLPGRPYIAPPPSHKANLFSLSEQQFRTLLLQGALDDTVAVVMQKNLDGLSIPTCRELVKLAGLEPSLLLNYCGEHELRSLWQTLQDIVDAAKSPQPRSTLVYGSDGEPRDFFAITPVPDQDYTYSQYEPSVTADLFFNHKQAKQDFQRQKNKLQGSIRKEQRRLQKKLALQRQSIADAEKGDLYRLYGEIIIANLYQIKRGLREVELVNYHDPDGGTVTIPLAPEKSGAENAQVYFKKYNKARNTRQAADKIIRANEKELLYLEGVATALEIAEDMSDLEEIKRELVGQGYIKAESGRAPGKKRQSKQQAPRSKPLRFLSQDGFHILVGKNNRQNDQLTLKTGEEHDLWLHASKIPGSHVLIQTQGREVSDTTLLAAAQLAAYYSQSRASSNVPVDYTLRKHVKKPGGAKPGYVIYEKQKTLVVNPGKDLVLIP